MTGKKLQKNTIVYKFQKLGNGNGKMMFLGNANSFENLVSRYSYITKLSL
jgi:hypothetical protein